MLARVLSVTLAAGTLVAGHAHHHVRQHRDIHLAARQGPGSTTARPTGTQSSGPTGTSVPSPGVTAPGAMPLASIVPASILESLTTTSPLPTTVAGAKPTGLPSAPALPDVSGWNPAKYPALDKVPAVDSDEVIGWINEVRNSGIVIPDIKPHAYDPNTSMCSVQANIPRIKNDTECWWTCGHCVRKTDIVECKKQRTWGSSFDDGPTDWTNKLLHYLDDNDIKTTFFVVGSRVVSRPHHLRTEYLLGHQIAVHGWSHTPMTTQTSEQLIAELGWTKKVIKDAIGVTPMYFRPPYGDIDDRVRAIGKAMGMTPVMWTSTGTEANPIVFDVYDHEVPAGTHTAQEAYNQFMSLLTVAETYRSGFIVLAHDLRWQQVELATGYFLPSALGRNFDIVSVNECMSQELSDTYVETNSRRLLPPGTGLGNDIVFTGQTAPPLAPLGGSDGSNTVLGKAASNGGDDDGGDGDAGFSVFFAARGGWTMAAGVAVAGVLAALPALA